MARHAFGLFDDGVHPVDVVRQTGMDPRAVRAMYREWVSLRGGVFVPAEIVAKIAALPRLQGPNLLLDPTAEKLLQCIDRSTRTVWVCSACESKPPDVCSDCAQLMSEREARRRASEARQRAELAQNEKALSKSMNDLERLLRRKRSGTPRREP